MWWCTPIIPASVLGMGVDHEVLLLESNPGSIVRIPIYFLSSKKDKQDKNSPVYKHITSKMIKSQNK